MLVSEWLDGIRWPGSSPRARPLNGTGRAPRSSVSCSRVLRGSGSCTRIRTLATSASLPTGGSACSTSALSTGYQTASCRPPTYSSIGHRHLAWACSASSNAKRPSALKCCDGYPGTWTRPSPGRSPSPAPASVRPVGAPGRIRAASHRRRPCRIRAAGGAGEAEKVHAVGQSGAARQDGSVSVASWARTDNMVGRAVEGRHG